MFLALYFFFFSKQRFFNSLTKTKTGLMSHECLKQKFCLDKATGEYGKGSP